VVATHDKAAARLDTGPMDDARGFEGARVKVLRLEIEVDRDPIAGRLSEDGGPGRPFAGWLGLARALALALEPGEPGPGG
jgi:hypothetical protein